MIKFRTASALAVGAVAALAIGGTALAAGADDPAPVPSVSDDRGVDLLPDGDVSPSAGPSPSATSVLPVGPRSTHDANDDHGRNRGADDDATDDHGRNRGADDDATDDHGGRGHGGDDDANGGHGSDD